MSEMGDYSERCAKIAERFLLTAVIVDDEAQIQDSPRPTASLRKPDRYTSARASEETSGTNEAKVHSLDARPLVNSFAEYGVICAVMAPWEDDSLAATVLPAAKRADIVILDWRLHQDQGDKASQLLTNLLEDSEAGQLRLVAVYTGEDKIRSIGETLKKKLAEKGWDFQSDDRNVELSYGHCRIVIYAKSGTSLTSGLEDRAISEDDIPKRLIGDFADMTKGLLPSIALTSLAAVRENAHKVLDSFSAELDPAFLAHRACLSTPDDSQQHVVNLLDSELHAIMDDAATQGDPASIEAIKEWLLFKFGQEKIFEFGPTKKLSFDKTVSLFQYGLDKSDILSRKDFRILSSRFSRNDEESEELDQRLAWMFNFRTVNNSPSPILHLGTALQIQDRENGADLFLCMRPRCDSLRLRRPETFPLLPLVCPNPKQEAIQLVLKTDKNEYLRRSVCTNPSKWLLPEFLPDDSKECVVAEKGDDGQFSFTCTKGTRFKWIGELKADFAQRVAQHFASGLSRVATDNSEWLRRRERSGG